MLCANWAAVQWTSLSDHSFHLKREISKRKHGRPCISLSRLSNPMLLTWLIFSAVSTRCTEASVAASYPGNRSLNDKNSPLLFGPTLPGVEEYERPEEAAVQRVIKKTSLITTSLFAFHSDFSISPLSERDQSPDKAGKNTVLWSENMLASTSD